MTKLLIRLFIRNAENTEDATVRTHYGLLGRAVGIFCNLALFSLKLVLGMLSGSIAVTADAFNNLSDAGSSVVGFVGIKLSSKPADAKHPFGHGRIEYLSALFVALIIMVLAVELGISSFEKILSPEPLHFNAWVLVGLLLSVGVKLWMSLFNRGIGKRIHSSVLMATGRDALNDVISTGATIVSLLISAIFNITVDGYIGLLVACFVLYSGFSIIKDSISPLLGEAPDPESVKAIEKELLSNEYILGIHDLVMHNYGPGRCFASVHAEVPADSDIVKVHEAIDCMELKIQKEMNILITIHMDPLGTSDERTEAMRLDARSAVKALDPRMDLHDFRMVDGENRITLLFDVAVPPDYKGSQEELSQLLNRSLAEMNSKYHAVIHMDYRYDLPAD